MHVDSASGHPANVRFARCAVAALFFASCWGMLVQAAAAVEISVLGDSLGVWTAQLPPQVSVPQDYTQGGATSADLLSSQIPAAVAGLGSVDYTVMMIGGNDMFQTLMGQATINAAVTNIKLAVDQLQAGGARLILATIPNVLVTPLAQGVGPAQAIPFANAVAAANAELHDYFQARNIPYFDLDNFIRNHAAEGTDLVLGDTQWRRRHRESGQFLGPARLLGRQCLFRHR